MRWDEDDAHIDVACPPCVGAQGRDIILVIAREIVACTRIEVEVVAIASPILVGADVDVTAITGLE